MFSAWNLIVSFWTSRAFIDKTFETCTGCPLEGHQAQLVCHVSLFDSHKWPRISQYADFLYWEGMSTTERAVVKRGKLHFSAFQYWLKGWMADSHIIKACISVSDKNMCMLPIPTFLISHDLCSLIYIIHYAVVYYWLYYLKKKKSL